MSDDGLPSAKTVFVAVNLSAQPANASRRSLRSSMLLASRAMVIASRAPSAGASGCLEGADAEEVGRAGGGGNAESVDEPVVGSGVGLA